MEDPGKTVLSVKYSSCGIANEEQHSVNLTQLRLKVFYPKKGISLHFEGNSSYISHPSFSKASINGRRISQRNP